MPDVPNDLELDGNADWLITTPWVLNVPTICFYLLFTRRASSDIRPGAVRSTKERKVQERKRGWNRNERALYFLFFISAFVCWPAVMLLATTRDEGRVTCCRT